ncbi:DUF2860 family protein [Photobacterium sp. MCCC 1A19761]|uniref:DUF2860 family protein n=1 Tax=Photobacterium sp. MCCC 1A19761 TaxID=3115000 RepID=UPI00307E2112
MMGLLASGMVCDVQASQGLSGEIGFLLGESEVRSNFNTDHAVKTGDLNSEGKSETEEITTIFGQLRYDFGDHQLFAGTSDEDIVRGVFALELGYRYTLAPESHLSLAFLPSVVDGKTWVDPYLVNVARQETDVSGNALRLQYDVSIFSADLIVYERELDRERSGQQLNVPRQSLVRDGDGYLARVAVGLPLGSTSYLEPALIYRDDNAEGKAMAYQRLGVELTYHFSMGPHQFALDGRYARSEYDAVHPVFGKTRDEDHFSTVFTYEYQDIAGWQGVSLLAMAMYQQTDANIAFYDQDTVSMMVGATYTF